MKKIFMALMLSLVSICSLHAESSCYKGYTDDLQYILSDQTLAEDVPPTIVYNYKQGEDCFIAGSILAGIGGFLVIPGIFQTKTDWYRTSLCRFDTCRSFNSIVVFW